MSPTLTYPITTVNASTDLFENLAAHLGQIRLA
jgi:hypothetical protein